MDRKILEDYIDACEYIRETRAEIARLKGRKRTVRDKVRGSNPDWPYERRSFCLEGTAETPEESGALAREEKLLQEQVKTAEELKLGVEEWMQDIPFRMQRIIRYKFFNRLSWEEVATLMKCKSGGEAIRKEYDRFMRKK